MEHQFHYGKKFYQDQKTGYWISTTLPKIRAHVWVWKYNHGEICKGMQVHHIDEDKSNNEIHNLEILTAKEHVSKHFSEERSAKNKIHIENIRPLTKEWHASPEGIEWHRVHGSKTWEERIPFQVECKQCSKTSETKTYHQYFCSNACKSAWRRKDGIDNEERQCSICHIKFMVNKYGRQRTCGRKCGRVLVSQKRGTL